MQSRRAVEVQNHPTEVRIFEEGRLIASHPVLRDRGRPRVDPAHRKALPVLQAPPRASGLRRPLDFHDRVGRRFAAGAGR